MKTNESVIPRALAEIEESRDVSRGWTVELFAAFWAKPSASMDHIPSIVAADIVGHWPGGAAIVRGARPYWRYVVELLKLVPDFRLRVLESASNDEIHFILWEAYGTGPDGAFTCVGCDCVRARDGIVLENRIHTDHPIFRALAARVAARADH